MPRRAQSRGPALTTLLGEWGRIGCLGFGGPPAHIALLRELCVTRREWIEAEEFEDAIAATNLLPGPASTQLAIYCAWRLGGSAGAIVGGLAFIVPGLVAILALAAIFLSDAPPEWILGAGAGAGAAVPAVALRAAAELAPASWQRSTHHARWVVYALAGAGAAALSGVWVILVLLACGVIETTLHSRPRAASLDPAAAGLLAAAVASGGLLALAWVAIKVGLLSYGGGFVIIPLMQQDAVETYRWMTNEQFLNAVALGQVTPGPVVHTVAAVGYAAAGIGGGLLAATVAFAPSFAFVLMGADRFDALRANPTVQGFLTGAGPAAIGAIAGSAIPLALALDQAWQVPVLAGAALATLAFQRGIVMTLMVAGAIGAAAVLVGAPVPG